MANISAAAAAQKVYILHKKPPLVELCVQSPERPNRGSAGRSQPCGPRPCTHKSGGSGQARLMSATPPKAAPKADIPGSPSRANTRHQAHPDGGLFVVVHLGQCDSALAR